MSDDRLVGPDELQHGAVPRVSQVARERARSLTGGARPRVVTVSGPGDTRGAQPPASPPKPPNPPKGPSGVSPSADGKR